MKSLGLTRHVMIASLLLLFVAARSASAAVYYASPTGSASWPNCTVSSSPCSAATALANAIAGDTVNFLVGTYVVPDTANYEYPNLNPTNSGTSGNPITFQANPGDKVIFTGNNPTSHAQGLIGSNGRNYITWRGIILDTSSYGDVSGNAITFNNCTGVIFEGLTLIGHSYSNNTVHWSGAYSGVASNNVTFRNCTIYGWHNPKEGAGIGVFRATGLLIENNEIYNCDRGISGLEAATNHIWRYNLIHDITSLGIYGPGNKSNNTVDIYQNIFYNIGTNVMDIQNDWPGSFFHNNTIYTAGTGLNYWSTVTAATALTVYNNIFHTVPTTAIYKGVGLLYADYNDYYSGGVKITGFDANSITFDPLFVNVAMHDYHLQSSSPARTSGRGGIYPSAMGAYITGSEIIGTSGTPIVAPPGPPHMR